MIMIMQELTPGLTTPNMKVILWKERVMAMEFGQQIIWTLKATNTKDIISMTGNVVLGPIDGKMEHLIKENF